MDSSITQYALRSTGTNKPGTRYFWLMERTTPKGEFKPFYASELRHGVTLGTAVSWFVARAGYWSDVMKCDTYPVEGEDDHIFAYHRDGTFAAELMIAEQLADPPAKTVVKRK